MAPVYSSYDDSSSSGSQTVRNTLIKCYDCCQGQNHCNVENNGVNQLRSYRSLSDCRSQSSNYHLNYSRDEFLGKSMRIAVPNQCNATNAIDCKQPNDDHCHGSYPIRLRANHFDISIEHRTPLVLHHYLIRIFAPNQRQQETNNNNNNKGHSRRLVKELIELVIEANKKTIFKPLRTATDGKSNLYALELLTLNKEKCLELAIEHPRKGREEETLKSVLYKISFEYIESLIIPSSLDDLGHDNEIEMSKIHMALDIIMRHLANMRYTSVGRSFFSPPQCTLQNHEYSQFSTNCDHNSHAGHRNIDIAHRNRMLAMITANRINFSNQIMSHIAREHPLGSGREAWFGYHQSLRISKWKMMLNIDVSVTAFYKTQNVVDFFKDILGTRESQYVLVERRQILEQDRFLLAKEIKGLKVEVIHSRSHRRRYKVNNVTKLSASELSFSYNDSSGETREMTIENYFLGRYGITLKYPHLVCLQVGVESKPTFLPMELCTIVKAQRCIKKLNDMQTSNMIRATAKCAPDRESEINRLMDRIYQDNSQVFKNFGINVSRKMTEITGKVLQPPKLQYGGKGKTSFVVPSQGVWDMRGKQFFFAVNVEHWAVVSLCSQKYVRADSINYFISQFIKISQETGMRVCPKPVCCTFMQTYGNTAQQSKEILESIKIRHPKLQLLIVILSGRSQSYAEVKRIGDHQIQIPTQCVQAKNILKFSPQTISNLCLKINAKLGGINSILHPTIRSPIFNEPVIFFGADITHPASNGMNSTSCGSCDRGKTTIVGVVASIDAHPFSYSSAVRIQSRKYEHIVDLKNIAIELLIEFYNATSFKPVRIVFYRDGVTENQFKNVVHHEVSALRDACRDLEDNYEPGITYIMIQKRHHTRLFCADPSDSIGKSRNIPAGTLVDSKILSPSSKLSSSSSSDGETPNFFLCSHAGIQGTSRPSHYHVLWDDNDLLQQELHTLTYQLCHTYMRCTRSVSVPAPAYYAHLVAFRARYYVMERQADIHMHQQQSDSPALANGSLYNSYTSSSSSSASPPSKTQSRPLNSRINKDEPVKFRPNINSEEFDIDLMNEEFLRDWAVSLTPSMYFA